MEFRLLVDQKQLSATQLEGVVCLWVSRVQLLKLQGPTRPAPILSNTPVKKSCEDTTHGTHVGVLRLKAIQPALRVWHVQWRTGLIRKREE